MNEKQWDAFLTYLDIVHRKTNRVLRELDEFHQFPDPRPDFREGLDKKFLGERIKMALDTLTQRERTIIELRFGLKDGKPLSFEQIAPMFDIGRERVHQLEAKALRKLRNPGRIKLLLEPEAFKVWNAKFTIKKMEEAEKQRIEFANMRAGYYGQDVFYDDPEKKPKPKPQPKTESFGTQVLKANRDWFWKIQEKADRDAAALRAREAQPEQPPQDNRAYRWDAIRRVRIYDE